MKNFLLNIDEAETFTKIPDIARQLWIDDIKKKINEAMIFDIPPNDVYRLVKVEITPSLPASNRIY